MKKNWMPLSSLAEINPPLSQALDPSQQVAFLPMAAVSEHGYLHSVVHRPAIEVLKGYTSFQEGDILLAKITPCMENGKAAIATPLLSSIGFGSTEFHVIRPKGENDSRFLFHAIWNARFRQEAAKNMTGSAGQKRVPKSFVERYQIVCPAPDQQKRIAAILDQADAIRRKRQEALRLTDDFLRSVFFDIFGDLVTNPKGWEKVKSSSLFSDKPRLGTMQPARGEGYLVVRVGEIGKEQINFLRCGRTKIEAHELIRFQLEEGDTVLARAIGSRDQLGKCSYFDGYSEIVVADSHVMRLRPDPSKCDPYWFYYFLSSDAGRRQIQESGGATTVQFNINGTQASNLLIPLPPFALQHKFAKMARQARVQRLHQETASVEAETLFQSLQYRAFTGQL